MENKICSYECMFITNASLAEEDSAKLIGKFTKLIAKNGTIVKIDEWGKRRLAYPINDMVEGIYTLVTFKSEPTLPLELKRVFGITEGILRSMIVRLEDIAEEATAPATAEEVVVEEVAKEAPATEEVAETTEA